MTTYARLSDLTLVIIVEFSLLFRQKLLANNKEGVSKGQISTYCDALKTKCLLIENSLSNSDCLSLTTISKRGGDNNRRYFSSYSFRPSLNSLPNEVQ